MCFSKTSSARPQECWYFEPGGCPKLSGFFCALFLSCTFTLHSVSLSIVEFGDAAEIASPCGERVQFVSRSCSQRDNCAFSSSSPSFFKDEKACTLTKSPTSASLMCCFTFRTVDLR